MDADHQQYSDTPTDIELDLPFAPYPRVA